MVVNGSTRVLSQKSYFVRDFGPKSTLAGGTSDKRGGGGGIDPLYMIGGGIGALLELAFESEVSDGVIGIELGTNLESLGLLGA